MRRILSPIIIGTLSLALWSCAPGQPAGNPATGTGSAPKVETLESLTTKAEAGDVEAQFELGAIYHDGQGGVPQDYAKAREWFEKAANQGEVKSQFNLGVVYYTGKGVQQDFAKARYWFEKAAAAGNARSQFNLGVMYYQGEGVTKDHPTALKLFRQAAEQNFGEAQFNLGVMYARGEGVPADGVQSYMWWDLALKQQNPKAQTALDSLAPQLTAEEIAEAKRLSEGYTKKFESLPKSLDPLMQ
jgi:uncharacterized protein